ncbi:MAG: hypothetical protein R3C41_12060 [Calditrichia bacterium]
MPADATLNRINTLDLFGVVIPGMYLAANVSLLGFAFIDRTQSNQTPWEIINTAVSGLNISGFLILIISGLLLGSMARAFPVKTVDQVSGWLNRLTSFSKRKKGHYSHEFPYNVMLETIFKNIKSEFNLDDKSAPPKTEETYLKRTGIFNFWKILICRESPELFALISSAEARVRMIVGIIWSTAWSSLISLIALVLPYFSQWHEPFILSLAVSVILCLLFTLQLRPMRHEEVRSVFLAFLSLQRKQDLTNNVKA